MESARNLEALESPIVIEEGMYLKDIEKLAILSTLKKQKFNRTRSAKVLGIGIRTLQRKLKQYQSEMSA